MSRQSRDVEFIHSPMGGGWILPKSDRARETLERFFDDPPSAIGPLDRLGWIVEPSDMEDLGETVQDAGLSVEA